MSNTCIITGTDTDVGKTVVAAMLTLALGATYWKPVQSGVEGGVDTKTVQKMTGLPAERFLPESYVFSEPLSPHRSAEIDGAKIDVDSLNIPQVDGPLLIEGAGGDFSARWLGKWKMVVQCIAVCVCLLCLGLQETDGSWAIANTALMWASVIITLHSGFDYIMVAAKTLSNDSTKV